MDAPVLPNVRIGSRCVELEGSPVLTQLYHVPVTNPTVFVSTQALPLHPPMVSCDELCGSVDDDDHMMVYRSQTQL